MGAKASKWNRCCSNNQSMDGDELKKSTSRTKARLYRTNSTDSSSEGEKSYDSSSESEVADSDIDPAQLQIKAQVVESFKVAIQNGNTSLVEYYFNEHPDLHLARTKWRNGDSCLHVAVRNKDEKLIRFLISEGVKHGVNINEQNTMTGDTCLHTAVIVQNPDIVQLLIDLDIDVNVTNKQFHSPLRIAVEQRSFDIMDILSKYSLDLDEDSSSHESSDSDVPPRRRTRRPKKSRPKTVMITSPTGDTHNYGMSSGSISPRSRSPRSWSPGHTPRSVSPRYSPAPPRFENFGSNMSNPSLRSDSGYYSASGYLSEQEYGKLTIEEKMDDFAKHTLAKVNLKSKNPFSKVRVTKQEGREVKKLLRELEQLPELNGFLQKQTSKPPFSFHKRWVYVTEEWMFWNDRMISTNFCDEGPTLEERNRFNGAVHLKNVVSVETTGKSGRKFMLKVQYKKGDRIHYRKVLWRCHNEQERNYWRNGLAQYVKYCKALKKLYAQ